MTAAKLTRSSSSSNCVLIHADTHTPTCSTTSCTTFLPLCVNFSGWPQNQPVFWCSFSFGSLSVGELRPHCKSWQIPQGLISPPATRGMPDTEACPL